MGCFDKDLIGLWDSIWVGVEDRVRLVKIAVFKSVLPREMVLEISYSRSAIVVTPTYGACSGRHRKRPANMEESLEGHWSRAQCFFQEAPASFMEDITVPALELGLVQDAEHMLGSAGVVPVVPPDVPVRRSDELS